MSQRVRDLGLNFIVAAAYWLVAELTLLPATAGGSVTPMWPAAGIALAAILLGGARLLPGVALGAFMSTTVHIALLTAPFVAVGMVVQAFVNARILGRFGFDDRFERIRDPLLFGAVTCLGAFVSALFAITGVAVVDLPDVAPWIRPFVIWWMRDWLGTLIIASLILTWVRSRPVVWTTGRIVEAASLVVGLLAFSQVMFGVRPLFEGQRVPLAFTFFPVVGYAGLRFGPRGAATLVAVAATVMLPLAALRLGPFAEFSTAFSIFVMHLFLTLGWISGLTLAAVRSEWEDALRRRLALEEQLRHSQKMEAVGRLAGGIAHDFNNLLTAIIGYTELVMVSLEPGDPRRGDAEEIARAAMRAADLTRQMLAFSRKQVLQPKVIDLNGTLAKVEPMLRRLIGEDIILTIAPKATRPQVRVDPGQIEQVIMNLAVNARDAMPHGGRLTVETGDAVLEPGTLPPDARAGPYVMLAVSDTGVGMSADVRARIFEPYFTTKEIGKGTGLGLSTAYGIVSQSEGHIQVSSEPGQGTSFRIYLPRTAETAAVQAVVADDMPGGTEHILLVEDDPSVRRLSREILVRLGYTVTEAASGRAGLALGSDDTKHFDLALCDVILGDMSGPAVYEALRALRPQVHVLYMSGYADEAIVRTGVLDEGHPFLQKPFTPRDLALRIREVLDRREGE